MTFVEGTEAHGNYHMWCALSALSSIVSKRVWLDQGHFQVYCNLYICLVGSPGSRKSTAIEVALQFIEELAGIPITIACTSYPQLLQELESNQRVFQVTPEKPPIPYCPMSIVVDELSNFLSISQAQMIDLLTTIYGRRTFDYKTKNKGSNKILGPYVTLLAGTVPDWIATYLKTDIITGGFSRRCIFVYEMERNKPNAFPSVSTRGREAWARMLTYGKMLQGISGPFEWPKDSMNWYEHWYENQPKCMDKNLVGYYDSRHMQLCKVAMLLALADRPLLVLEKKYMEQALRVLEMMEKNLGRVFEGVGKNDLNAAATYVMDFIERAGGYVPDKTLKRATFHQIDSQQYNYVMQHLVDTDRLVGLMEVVGNVNKKYFFLPTAYEAFVAEKNKRKTIAEALVPPSTPHDSGSADRGVQTPEP